MDQSTGPRWRAASPLHHIDIALTAHCASEPNNRPRPPTIYLATPYHCSRRFTAASTLPAAVPRRQWLWLSRFAK